MIHNSRALVAVRPRSAIALVAAACAVPGAYSTAAQAAERAAAPSTLSSTLASAQSGDVITLASGDYGTFSGRSAAGQVTVRAAQGAEPTMSINWSNAANLRVEGVTIRGATISGSTHDVTIANSRFTGGAVVRAESMANANIVFDGNTHAGIDACSGCYEGRLQIAGLSSQPSGVVIRNSTFGPGGTADGIQNGANGVQILNNTFTGIRQVSDVHSDALQLYGQRNTVVRGNYFIDNDVAIMGPDGGEREQIVDNVFVGGGRYRPAVQLGSQDSTLFAHNVVRNLDVFVDAKSGESPSRNAVVRDNVFVDAAANVPASKCSGCTVTHNLFNRNATGDATIVAAPAFAGGANPSSYAGHVLAPGSPGKGNASDGTDRGIRLQPDAPGAAAPPPGSGPAGQGAPGGAIASARVRTARRITVSRLRRGLRVRVSVGEPVKIVLRLSRKRSGKAVARKVRRMAAGRHTFVLRPRVRVRPSRKLVLMVRMTTRAGQTNVIRRTVRVKKR